MTQADPNALLSQRFHAIDAGEISLMLARGEPEGLQLDFKHLAQSGDPSDDDKRNLRQALSGFANSVGGIVIWGASTKDGQGREQHRLQALVPIANERVALKRLHELTGDSTDPPVSSVLHEAIVVPNGYLIKTFVPASDATPHRTRGKDGQYYRRHADRFFPMEHFEIADMFGRRAKPLLELAVLDAAAQVDRASSPQNPRHKPNISASCRFFVSLINRGRGLAKFASVRISLDKAGRYSLTSVHRPHVEMLPSLPSTPGEIAFAAGLSNVIHPGAHLPVFTLDVGVSLREEAGQILPIHPVPDLSLAHSVAAEGVPAAQGTLSISGADALEKAKMLKIGESPMLEWFQRENARWGH